MARTKDPSAATTKAWKTRKRNAGEGRRVKLGGGEILLAPELDVGFRPRAVEGGGSSATSSRGDWNSQLAAIPAEGSKEERDIQRNLHASPDSFDGVRVSLQGGSGDRATDATKRPPFILGAQHSAGQISDYLAKAGATVKMGSPLPTNVLNPVTRMLTGDAGQCYTNATNLVVRHPTLYDYAEGIAWANGMPYMHAWGVEKKTGNVVDTTWTHHDPKTTTYYGVTYDRKKLFKHMVKTEMYGVLGGHRKAAETVMEKGGL